MAPLIFDHLSCNEPIQKNVLNVAPGIDIGQDEYVRLLDSVHDSPGGDKGFAMRPAVKLSFDVNPSSPDEQSTASSTLR